MIAAVILSATVAFARPVRLRRRTTPVESSVADFARLLSIAAASGLPLGSALDAVIDELSGSVGESVRSVVRSARRTGLTAALLSAPELGSLAPALARAHSTGSPLGQTLDAYLTAHAADRVTRALEKARTAPVRVMVPLALLLLPGFTALVVGPTLLDHVFDMTRFGR
ncbi:MAG: type II secretion system F family protein [Acidimicrobiia bacterium]